MVLLRLVAHMLFGFCVYALGFRRSGLGLSVAIERGCTAVARCLAVDLDGAGEED